MWAQVNGREMAGGEKGWVEISERRCADECGRVRMVLLQGNERKWVGGEDTSGHEQA